MTLPHRNKGSHIPQDTNLSSSPPQDPRFESLTILDLGHLPADIPQNITSPPLTLPQRRHAACHSRSSLPLDPRAEAHVDRLLLSESIQHRLRFLSISSHGVGLIETSESEQRIVGSRRDSRDAQMAIRAGHENRQTSQLDSASTISRDQNYPLRSIASSLGRDYKRWVMCIRYTKYGLYIFTTRILYDPPVVTQKSDSLSRYHYPCHCPKTQELPTTPGSPSIFTHR